MRNIKTAISAAISVIALASTAPAYGQSSNLMMSVENPVTMWALTQTSEELGIFLQTTSNARVKITPWIKESPSAVSPIIAPKYTRVSMSDFDYSIAGPIKLSVGKRYVRQRSTNLPQQAGYLATKVTDDNPYELSTYEIASSATIGFNVEF